MKYLKYKIPYLLTCYESELQQVSYIIRFLKFHDFSDHMRENHDFGHPEMPHYN